MTYFAYFCCGFFAFSAIIHVIDLLRSKSYPRERTPETLKGDVFGMLFVLAIAIWGVLAVTA